MGLQTSCHLSTNKIKKTASYFSVFGDLLYGVTVTEKKGCVATLTPTRRPQWLHVVMRRSIYNYVGTIFSHDVGRSLAQNLFVSLPE